MRRSLLLLAILAGCSGTPGHSPDAMPDTPGSGSSAAFDGLEPSPPDVNLELIVVALSVVVAAGPVRASRKRRAL